MNKERSKPVKGYFKREIIFKDGSKEVSPPEGLNHNLIVDTGSILLAGLFSGESTFEAQFGDLYFTLGNGSSAWDAEQDKGQSHAIASVDQLVSEVIRKLPTTVRYTTTLGGSPSVTPTKYVQLVIVIDDDEIIDEVLREFGVFSGTATDTPDSGLLWNYVIFDAYTKTEAMSSITYTLNFEF